jgi:hypothetical protein
MNYDPLLAIFYISFLTVFMWSLRLVYRRYKEPKPPKWLRPVGGILGLLAALGAMWLVVR